MSISSIASPVQTIRQVTLDIISNGSGVGSAQSISLWGVVERISWKQGTFASTVDVSLATENAEVLWSESNISADKIVRPRAQMQSSAGAALSGIYEPFRLFGEKVTATIAQGGAGKAGSIVIWLRPLD